MLLTMKSVAVLTVAIVLGVSSNHLAPETDGTSLEALKQEVAELKQVVTQLSTRIENLETRLRSIERSFSQRVISRQHTFPLDVEIGTWIDDLQMQQKYMRRRIGEGVIRPVKPPR